MHHALAFGMFLELLAEKDLKLVCFWGQNRPNMGKGCQRSIIIEDIYEPKNVTLDIAYYLNQQAVGLDTHP